MTVAPTPRVDESSTTEADSGAPRVKVLLSQVEGADLEAALAVLARQAYEPAPEVEVVGGHSGRLPEGVRTASTLEEAIAASDPSIDYLWILHSDARPRPDALGALVAELERNEAALGGSKLLVAGTENELESIGSATDVFGEPYSGLDEGEIDLQQYDVVREVAFVRSASMLVRRDLAQGLRGLDDLLPPVAAGLDFSQRARLAGGKVISVPSSEVYHQGHCGEHVGGWKEQAGRFRAMLTAYRPLTLLWVIPYEILVALLDSLASLFLLRWRPLARHVLSWGWNIIHLPSTFGLRRRFRPVRTLGDEELFRFQSRGSVRLRAIGSEITGRVLSVFDEDQAFTRRSERVWRSPGIWGAVIAMAILAFGARSIVFEGVPNVGFSFPFEPPLTALERFFAGWNESGLGSPSPVHPSVGATGLASLLWFGAEGAARTLLTLGLALLAVVGIGRLGGRLGFRGPGRYLSGLVLLAGPGTALLAGRGSWLALAAASALPWATRAAFVHPHEEVKGRLSHLGWAGLFGLPLAVFSPLLAVIPLVAVIVWKLWGGKEARLILALATLLGVVAAIPFLIADPGWILDADRRVGLSVATIWPVLVGVAFLPLAFLDASTRRLATLGALLSFGGMVGVLFNLGPGPEEGALVVASFGAALVAAAGLDVMTTEPLRLAAAIASLVMVVISAGWLLSGRLGLPDGDLNEELAFAVTLADDHGPGRLLVASLDRADIPGDARSGPGFWYRVIDGGGMTHDEVLLAEALPGDGDLASTIRAIAEGGALRPGALLAPFAVDWVVLLGPSFRLDEVLVGQLDLVPTPLNPGTRVFSNPAAEPLADSGTESVWRRSGTGFAGEKGSGRVSLALNHDDGWGPEPGAVEWYTSVSAVDGTASFSGDPRDLAWAAAAVALVVVAAGLILAARLRR